jgi:hypothetical protein
LELEVNLTLSRDQTGSHREFGIVRALIALTALSPLCAVGGLMLAQILGLVPY